MFTDLNPLTPDQKRELFKECLKKSGWTQTEASKRLKISRASVAGYISGNRTPKLTLLKQFYDIVPQVENSDAKLIFDSIKSLSQF